MRSFTVASIVATSAAIVMLSACSGAPQSNSVGPPQTGTAPQVLRPAGPSRGISQGVADAAGSFLYVADYSKDSIEILQRLHQRWTNVGSIKESVLDPLSVWVDRSENLYVANGGGPVNEYDSSGKLIFEYESAGSARGVTTDGLGNVYVTGVDVSEYPQGVDNAFSCELPNVEPRSVAVDKDGDVFVGVFRHDAKGRIMEYVHGLIDSKCNATRLPIKFSSTPYGLAFDKEGNLLATDPDKGAGDIDVIAPPYTSITRKINSGGPWPLSVTINRINTRIYVTDSSTNTVQVISYPDGARIGALGAKENLAQPVSAVDGANYVP